MNLTLRETVHLCFFHNQREMICGFTFNKDCHGSLSSVYCSAELHWGPVCSLIITANILTVWFVIPISDLVR